MSHVHGKGATPSGNQPTTSTRGGASAFPTPANNTGGGSGWGDSGLLKGGLDRDSTHLSSSSGESNSAKLSSISGEMSSLTEQKAAGEQSYQQNLADAGAVPSSGNAGVGFMGHKPGGSDTLPGWEKAKGAFNSVMGNE
ncbi:hypothetical protein BDW62DRAFT_203411 [Aspergillus aurantiobrunneus]